MNDRHLTNERILEIVGVELGEEFKIEGYGSGNTYEFIKLQGDITLVTVTDCMRLPTNNFVFVQLLTGKLKVKKLPFVPKHGEQFWLVNDLGRVVSTTWDECCTADKQLFITGNCYRTKSKAEANIEKHKDAIERAYQARLEELQNG